MKKIFFLTYLCILLVSCAMTDEQRSEREAKKLFKEIEKKQKIVKKDKSKCASYGFNENTEAFSNCMMQLDISREEERALKKIVRCERIKQANNDPKRQPTGFWGGVLEGLSESGCD